MPQAPAVFLRSPTQRFFYDHAVDGGAVGDLTLRGGTLPEGAIVTEVVTNLITPYASGGAATLAAAVNTAEDLSVTNAYTSGGSPIVGIAIGDPAVTPIALFPAAFAAGASGITPIITTAVRSVVMTIAGAALTAGKFTLDITYTAPD